MAKDQINPVVQVLADVLRLQSPPVDGNELLGSGGPGRQYDIVDLLFGDLQMAQVESAGGIRINPVISTKKSLHQLVHVFEKLWEVKELGYELLYIVGIVHEQLPCLGYGVELSVGHIEAPTLEVDVQRGEGLHAE